MEQIDRGEADTLVSAAVGGDRAALERLWERHRAWVAAILLAHKPREAELEDLLQDVAMTVVTKLSDLRTEGAFRGWLRTVAVNAARSAGRRQTTRAPLLRKFATDAPSDRAADTEQTVSREEGQRLLELARDLPEGYRDPLLLRCVQGMSYRQIGQVLSLPESTIETRIARARRMVRERAQTKASGIATVRSGETSEAMT